MPILAGAIDITATANPGAQQQVGGAAYRRPGIPHPDFIHPPHGQLSHIVYRQTYQMPPRVLGVRNRNNSANVTIDARIQAINKHVLQANKNVRYKTLSILLPMEEAAELARIWQEDEWNGTASWLISW